MESRQRERAAAHARVPSTITCRHEEVRSAPQRRAGITERRALPASILLGAVYSRRRLALRQELVYPCGAREVKAFWSFCGRSELGFSFRNALNSSLASSMT